MKKSEIRVGGHYIAKVSGKLTTVRVDAIRERGVRGYGQRDGTAYDVTNLATGRKTTFRSAAKFRFEASKKITNVDAQTDGANDMIEQSDLELAERLRKSPIHSLPSNPLSDAVKATVNDKIEELQRQIAALEGSEDSCPFVAPIPSMVATATTTSSASQKTVRPTDEGDNRRPFASPITSKLAAQLSPASASDPSAGSPSVPHVEVRALAGTGKTTTVVQGLIEAKGGTPVIQPSEQQRAVWDALKLGRLDSVRVSAFNKSITEEMGNKLAGAGLDRKGVESRGVHSLGLQAVTRTFGRVRASQYAALDIVAGELGGNFRDLLKMPGMATTMKAVDELVSLCKQTLSEPTPEELDKLTSRFDVDCGKEQQKVYELVPTILDKCKTPQGHITFDDMVWLPVVLQLPIPKVDCQVCDESQDLSRMQQELMFKGGHRLIVVGDPNQSIYGFAGADSESMSRMKDRLSGWGQEMDGDRAGEGCGSNCITLPLTVTRRCGRAIVAEAQEYVPEYEAHESNPEGRVLHAKYPIQGSGETRRELPWEETYCPLAKDGCLVLCRVNAPLVSQCFRFLKRGLKATILGKKIGEGLVALVDKSKTHSVPDLVGWLDDWLAEEQAKEAKKRFPSESKLEMIQDKYDCVVAFTDGLRYPDEVKAKITSVFTDERNGRGVRFSSIHKSKGLEARQVFLLQPPQSGPRRDKMQGWELQQEDNLQYVAITRAIEELVYVK